MNKFFGMMLVKRWAIGLMIAETISISQALAQTDHTDEAIIESTYNAWVKTTNAKDLESWASYLAPNAAFTPPGAPLLETRETILDYYRKAFADPHFTLDCQQLEVSVAQSGRLAWARGVCHITFTGPAEEIARGKSRWFKVWLKQPDGSWKCRINTWNYEDHKM